jgi:outer membrane protein
MRPITGSVGRWTRWIGFVILLLTSACSTSSGKGPGLNIRPAEAYGAKAVSAASVIKARQGVPTPVPAPEGPLQITLRDAVLMALENNRSLLVERLNPAIEQTFVDEQRAAFDPVLGAKSTTQHSQIQRQARSGSGTENASSDVQTHTINLTEFFPTGTLVEAGGMAMATDSSLYQDPFVSARLGLSVTQSLLRGFGSSVNLAQLRQSRLATDISLYELRGFSASLVADAEDAYWDYALAQRQMEIVTESLKVARQQLAETEAMIQVGTLAESELVAVQAEVATQQQGLINARSNLADRRLRLLRLLNPPGHALWERQVHLVHPPTVADVPLDTVENHVGVARRMRAEINQAKLEIQRQELALVRTRNGLLPRLDLFIELGKTGYADSFSSALGDLDGNSYDLLVGLEVQYPLANRQARALQRRSRLSKAQAEKALENLVQLVELDVRSAYIEVGRAKEQIGASTATRKFQEEKLRIETERFRVGRATNFSVAQAQRDLLVSRIDEVQAVVTYLQALTSLYRLEGSLLERRGIVAPGDTPIERSQPGPPGG